MAVIFSRLRNRRGVTVMELLIAALLFAMVIGGGAAIYLTGVRFTAANRANLNDYIPPSLNQITKLITMSKAVNLSNGNSQLNLLCDCDINTLTPNASAVDVPGDDEWAHIRIIPGAGGNEIRWIIDNNANTTVNNPFGTLLISNLNGPASSFALVNPTGSDTNTVVEISLVFTNPATTLKTRAALMSGAKR